MGLGQYFGAIVHFAWLMVALFICVGCFHPHEFRTNNNRATSTWWLFTAVVDWPEPVTAQMVEKSDDDYKKETISIISNSAGTRCNDNMTSFYNCPTVCTFYTGSSELDASGEIWSGTTGAAGTRYARSICRAACPT